jgi:hypothetical protein
MEPVGTRSRRDKTIGIGRSGFDGILCHTGDTIGRVKAVNPMPVNTHTKAEMVHHCHDNQISLVHPQAGRGDAIEGPRSNFGVRTQREKRILGDKRKLVHMRSS